MCGTACLSRSAASRVSSGNSSRMEGAFGGWLMHVTVAKWELTKDRLAAVRAPSEKGEQAALHGGCAGDPIPYERRFRCAVLDRCGSLRLRPACGSGPGAARSAAGT